jgi:hypothetical protein
VGDLADVVPDHGSRVVLVRRLIAEGLLHPGPDAGSEPWHPTGTGPGTGPGAG